MDERLLRSELHNGQKTTPCIESNWRVKDKEGYYRINKKTHGYKSLHRLIFAKYHKITLTEKDMVRHLCGNASCLEPTHMALGTSKDNRQDTVRMDRHGHKLKKADASEIRRLYKKTNMTQKEIADKYDIAISLVSMIITGRIWK
jgi:hypothetical protein